jgi:murein L,D-transpeptidase YcbB/YkuD
MRNTIRVILGAAALLAATPLYAAPRGDEPVAVPTSIKQGIDFVYVDPEMSAIAKRRQKPQNWLRRVLSFDWLTGGDDDRGNPPNPIFVQLGQGLQQYQASWGSLPQIKVPTGAVLKRGSTGKRVDTLRTRLGLSPGGGYDEPLQRRVAAYQHVHGLEADGIAGRMTIGSLNQGAAHYARRIAINVERAWRLPRVDTFERYVIVDSGAAEAYLYEDDRFAEGMRVIVGSSKTKTPMLAVLMRNAKANPYWNVPPDMIADLTARRVLDQGTAYLKNFHYEVLSDWSANAQPVDPKRVDWKLVAAGKSGIRVRQLPGPWNSMGEMKFEMPNDYGIYLHDTPVKELFAKDDRWLSNGCVRLEDYRRFASWVFGSVPRTNSESEQVIPLPRPVPIYMTYFTVSPAAGGVIFRPDPYGFDALAMPQMFEGEGQVALAS